MGPPRRPEVRRDQLDPAGTNSTFCVSVALNVIFMVQLTLRYQLESWRMCLTTCAQHEASPLNLAALIVIILH